MNRSVRALGRCVGSGLLVGWFATAGLAAPGSSGQPSETPVWASYFWSRVETGSPDPLAAGFRFADPAMNKRGTFPLAGAVQLFRVIYAHRLETSATDCDAYDIDQLLQDDPGVRNRLRTFTLTGMLHTPIGDPIAFQHHLDLVVGAGGGVIGGIGLVGLDVVSGEAVSASEAVAIQPGINPYVPELVVTDPRLLALRARLADTAAAIRSARLDQQIDPLQMLSGGPSDFRSPLLVDDAIHAEFGDARVYPLIVLYGSHGMMAFSQVLIGPYQFIVDGQTGRSFGPYSASIEPPVRTALALHTGRYVAGMSVAALASSNHCVSSEHDGPFVPNPGGGWPTVPPVWEPGIPGAPTDPIGGWICERIGGDQQSCRCSRMREWCRVRTVYDWWGLWCTQEKQCVREHVVCTYTTVEGPCPGPGGGPVPEPLAECHEWHEAPW